MGQSAEAKKWVRVLWPSRLVALVGACMDVVANEGSLERCVGSAAKLL